MKIASGKRERRLERAIRAACIVAALAGPAILVNPARAADPSYEFNIPERDLGDALRQFGTISSTQILFSPELVRGKRCAAVQGRLSVDEAMGSLLAKSQLTWKRTAASVILVTKAETPDTRPSIEAKPTTRVMPEQAEPQVETVEEIIVTAGKRAENMQDVPASVLVVTSAVLESANVRDFDDIVKVAPSVTITKTSQPGNNSINIRGIGTYAYSIATEPSVAVVIDDVPQAFQAAAFAALVDVQQVEVLRGPQNTLFGKSASAGVISITTQAPTDHFTARLDAMTTDDGEQRYSGTLSGPISETLKVRLAANYSDYRGNVQQPDHGQLAQRHAGHDAARQAGVGAGGRLDGDALALLPEDQRVVLRGRGVLRFARVDDGRRGHGSGPYPDVALPRRHHARPRQPSHAIRRRRARRRRGLRRAA